MKILYDPEVDALNIIFSNSPIEESDEEQSGLIFDYDKKGKIVGIEILDASKKIDDPQTLANQYKI